MKRKISFLISPVDFKTVIKKLLKDANTILLKSDYEKLLSYSNEDKRNFILENCRIAKTTNRPLCQDTGQVLVFLKIPYSFSFGYDFKKIINEAVQEVYEQEFYRKSVVKNAIFDRKNTATNTPAIIYTDFEDRQSLKIDVLIKGGGAENMSFVEMFNPTTSHDEIIEKISQKIKERAENACPPLFIGLGIGATMDYSAVLSKKALFEGVENDFCNKLSLMLKDYVCSVKMISTSTHIASLPVAVTINCHSNRHTGCEIGKNGIIYDNNEYEIMPTQIDFSSYKKMTTNEKEGLKNLKIGEKILLSGTIYSMRDEAHKRVVELIEQDKELPLDIKNSIILYAGPAPKKENEVIGPIGPTTAQRMDKYAPMLYDLGCIATIGKGKRSGEVVSACERNNARYFTVYGGIACYLQSTFKSAECIAFEDLGTEAIYKYEVKDLPLIVEI